MKKAAFTFAFLLFATALTTSCTKKNLDRFNTDKHDKLDRYMDLSRDDYKKMAEPKRDANGEIIPDISYSGGSGPPIPDIAPILAAPRPPKIGESQLVSIAVTDDVPLKDVVLELAKLADVDVELDSNISGGVNFIAKEKPFNEVIDRLADLAGLRYSMKNGVLRVELDKPYIKSYALDFLNMDRSNESSVSLATNVLSGGGSSGGSSSSSSSSSSGSSSGGGGGLTTGSTSKVDSKTESDFWKQLDEGVKQILKFKQQKRISQSTNNVAQDQDLGSLLSGAAAPAAGTTGTSAAPSAAPAAATTAATSTATAEGAAEATGSASGIGEDESFYILNRQAGVLTISATDKQHQLLERFLAKLEANSSAQVLIEAKILEVQLNDSYQTGVDWRVFNNKLGLIFNPKSVIGTTSTGVDIGNPISFVIDKSPEDGIVNSLNSGPTVTATNPLGMLARLTEQFGTVRTLSSPRLNAMNNQVATLTFARNQVYFELSIEQNDTSTTGAAVNNTTVSSTIRTVPIGIILSLQPSINIATNEVTLSVRPTLSALVDEKPDPAVAYIAAQQGLSDLASTVPVVQVRELDSILKIKSGQTMVIGGLMEQGGSHTDTGVPYVSEVPYIGNLFKSTEKLNNNTELVIFIKATIVGSSGNSAPADRTLYDKFSDDPRPLTF